MYHGQLEGTSYEVIDKRFQKTFVGHARVERLWTGCRWAEGPAWVPAARHLIWSDIPNNRMLKYDECGGTVSVYRQPSQNSNGNTIDRQGRLVTCEHHGRRVSRTEHDGRVVTLADSYKGKRLNSPNDLAVKSDGSVWFTDPAYGIDIDYEGETRPMEQDGCHVYRIDPSGEITRVCSDFDRPNGIAFSPDESMLYIADTGHGPSGDGLRHIRRFKVGADGKGLSGGEVWAVCVAGVFDGFRLDTDGRIWTSAGDGVHCYLPDGTLIGKIQIPEIVSNVAWGGQRLNRLFICGTTSLYSTYLAVNGVPCVAA